jgi:ABC-type nitrate/sulfonate/bicarbonate transport system substrate-binding protein
MRIPRINGRSDSSMSHLIRSHAYGLSALVLVLATCFVASSSQAQEGRRLRAGYTALSGNMLPLWAARDGGYFKKYGLDFDLISMPSGNEGMSALIAGELEFLAIAGSTTASAAVGGADVIALGTTVERLVAFLVAAPSIQKPEDLKGKSVGISRFGTSIDTGARMAIQHYGLEPIKDVSIVQIGAVSSILSAMRGGRIQAAILTYPSIIQARREGYRELLDIASLGMPYASTGITVRRSYLQQRRDLVTNYVKAIVESIARVKKDKAFAVDVMGKYLRTTDKEVLEGTYDISVTKYLKRVPLPTPEAFRSVVDELAQVNPKAKGQDPKKFYDDSILRELEKSGFISALGG